MKARVPGAAVGSGWPRWTVPACVAVLAGMALVLQAMGRRWWCKCGSLTPWSGEINSMHNSQHFLDPYTFTHVLHGVAFYGVLALLLGRWLDPRGRLLVAVLLEALWEILENTSAVIEKYRAATISLDYYGDSILNSVADVLACILGYLIAMTVPVWVSVAGFVALEAVLVLTIRDSLLLNVLMLTYPIQAVRDWQMGSPPPPA